MKLNEALNRGFNLLATSVIGLAGIAFAAEIFLEHDWDDKLDDIGLLALGIIAVIWFTTGNRKYARSAVPVVLVILGLLDKIMAITIEFKDKESVGDDFGGLVLFLAASVLVLYQYHKTKKLAGSGTDRHD